MPLKFIITPHDHDGMLSCSLQVYKKNVGFLGCETDRCETECNERDYPFCWAKGYDVLDSVSLWQNTDSQFVTLVDLGELIGTQKHLLMEPQLHPSADGALHLQLSTMKLSMFVKYNSNPRWQEAVFDFLKL